MSIANLTDVEALLQINVTNPVDPMAVSLLELADDLIDAELGRKAEGGTQLVETIRITGGGPLPQRRSLLLDRWPAATIDNVDEDGTTLTLDTDYRIDDLEAAKITRLSGGVPIGWPWFVDIAVTYTPATPPGLRGVAASMVTRAFEAGSNHANKPSVIAGLKQLTIGRWSATAAGGKGQNAGDALQLLPVEQATVRAYRDRSA